MTPEQAKAQDQAVAGGALDMLQIKAIAQMISDASEFSEPDFPDTICGGVLAILEIASRSYDDLSAV